MTETAKKNSLYRIGVLYIFMAIGILIVLLALIMYQSIHKSTEMYEESLITYLEAMKQGTDKAIEYTAFPNEIIEYDYLHSPMRIADYEIVSSAKINENLYAFTMNIAPSDKPEVYTPLYYFVGQQDGKYTVYINAGYVPEYLHENFDANDYSYNNPDYLDSAPEFE